MKNKLDILNPQQRAAVLHIDGPLAIIAGAGSGKTKTLTHKITYLIQKQKILPREILAVTFTNKAANEMKERVKEMVGPNGADVRISTYHSMCVKILREDINKLGYPKNFNILDTDDEKKILSSVYKENNITHKTIRYDQMINYVSKNKVQGNTPEELMQNATTDNERVMSRLYQGYINLTKKYKSLDFDDLLIFCKKLLFEFPKVADKWKNRFKFVLIDEFQDTSLVQYEIITKISNGSNLTIVGDPDQTIYTWRGADDSLINNFQKYYKDASIIKLEQNYRSTKPILEKANKLINYNPNRIDKKLFTESEEEGLIDFFYARNDTAEARWISSKIKQLKKERVQLKDIVILYRAQYVSQAIERSLIEDNINYVVFGGIKFFQREEIKDVISFLKVLDIKDEISFERIINKPARGIGANAILKVKAFADENKTGVYNALTEHFKYAPLTNFQKNNVAELLNNLTKFRRALKINPISKVISVLLKEINYIEIWNKPEDAIRVDNIREFLISIKEWEEKNPKGTLSDYLEEVSLFIDREQEKISNNFVRLMTVHASKGLEFKYVFIAAFNDNVFPSQRALQENGNEALEEERRLAYVAITRAMKNLYISSSRGYTLDFKTQKKPSRFLDELEINISDYTNEFVAPKNLEDNYINNNEIIEGDKVAHPIFGEGVVANVSGSLATIIFNKPHGEKTLMKNHKTIERIE